MSKIIRTIVFLLVLAGLLSWGMLTLAQAPLTGSSHVLHGQSMEGVPVDPGMARPAGL
jgi:hypothetical protein